MANCKNCKCEKDNHPGEEIARLHRQILELRIECNNFRYQHGLPMLDPWAIDETGNSEEGDRDGTI